MITSENSTPMTNMNQFAKNVWTVDGPDVDFLGFPYPTRMTVIRLEGKDPPEAWLWSPIMFSHELARDIEEKAGEIKYIISPNKIHHIFLKSWSEKYPNATVYASPGLERRKEAEDIIFSARFGPDEPEPPFSHEIETVIVSGSYLMDEVVFFHKPTKTAIICDLIQRFPEDKLKGFKGMAMKLNGLAGKNGSTPREWRFSFWPFGRAQLKNARDKIFGWKAEKLIIAHGMCVDHDASTVIEDALSWM